MNFQCQKENPKLEHCCGLNGIEMFFFSFLCHAWLLFRHYGVLLLYGQHLGLNHLVATEEIRMIIGNNLLDQSSTEKSIEYVRNGIRLNLHCWHTDERFSKFAFKAGKYNQTDLELYRNDTTAQAYVNEENLFN